MADGTIYVPVAGTGAAPQTYTVPGATSIDLQAVRADFDGSGAATFKPAVQILDSSGHVMAQVVGEQVAAGGSASVTFAPFLRQAQVAAGGLATYYEAARGAATSYVVSGTPRIISWAITVSNDPGEVALTASSPYGTDLLIELVNPRYIYDVMFSVQWVPFAGYRSVDLNVVDATGAIAGEVGWQAPQHVFGSTTPDCDVQTITGTVLPWLATYPVWLSASLNQTSGVDQGFGDAFGLAGPSLLVRAFEPTP